MKHALNITIVIFKSQAKFKIILNYSRSSIWTGNCTMNPKIDPCSLNIAQPISKKGIKSLWQSSVRLLSCQGSLIVTIPAVHSAYRYLKVSHRIHFYKGSCYTVWMWYLAEWMSSNGCKKSTTPVQEYCVPSRSWIFIRSPVIPS